MVYSKLMKRATADLPLHRGRAPRWLFTRMAKLAGEVTKLVVLEHGTEGLLTRLSHPGWFQAFG